MDDGGLRIARIHPSSPRPLCRQKNRSPGHARRREGAQQAGPRHFLEAVIEEPPRAFHHTRHASASVKSPIGAVSLDRHDRRQQTGAQAYDAIAVLEVGVAHDLSAIVDRVDVLENRPDGAILFERLI